jgi:hypothetical protein
MSNGDLSDFHDGNKIPWSYGGFMDVYGDIHLMKLWKVDQHSLDVNFYVGCNFQFI